MSYFSTALQRQAELHRLNQSDLARHSGLSRSFITRVISGESRDLSDTNLIALLEIFNADPPAQADLIAARCLDSRQVAIAAKLPAADLVEIKIKPAGKSETTTPTHPEKFPLPAETERAFAWLRTQCPLNPDLEKHLIGYARLMGMEKTVDS